MVDVFRFQHVPPQPAPQEVLPDVRTPCADGGPCPTDNLLLREAADRTGVHVGLWLPQGRPMGLLATLASESLPRHADARDEVCAAAIASSHAETGLRLQSGCQCPCRQCRRQLLGRDDDKAIAAVAAYGNDGAGCRRHLPRQPRPRIRPRCRLGGGGLEETAGPSLNCRVQALSATEPLAEDGCDLDGHRWPLLAVRPTAVAGGGLLRAETGLCGLRDGTPR
mmetsp:Transcript_67083/g.169373  ORF Transcript_67083/g.169373 Transcript_67083/m.169373 type:complete len:223 (-) Transcript_67083:266-934(-)